MHQADAYAAHDYGEADRAYRDGYRHASELGREVAAALVAPGAATALQAPTWRLKSQLGQLLAEHVVQIVDATRAGLTNAPDFAAAGDAVNGNTRDLASVVASLFGGPAATAFESLWADHIDQLMAYTGGVVAHDAKRRDAAAAGLGTFESHFAAFLDTATQHRLDSATLAEALVGHDGMLLQHADAFAAKDYQKAHDIADSTYEQMYDLAGKLADAFGATVAARLPSGGPETGLGGMAGTVGGR
jgi:hypothetical protein